MKNPSQEFADFICRIYGDVYDDREEDSSPGGLDWEPGKKARHKSLTAFRRELESVHNISLSTSKIRKILITGGCWSTERSREVNLLYEKYTGKDGGGMTPEKARARIADELAITPSLVSMLLPYDRVVYDLEDKTRNAVRCQEWRRKTTDGEWVKAAVRRDRRIKAILDAGLQLGRINEEDVRRYCELKERIRRENDEKRVAEMDSEKRAIIHRADPDRTIQKRAEAEEMEMIKEYRRKVESLVEAGHTREEALKMMEES